MAQEKETAMDMTMKCDVPENETVIVVGENEVSHRSQGGYRLLAVIYEDQPTQLSTYAHDQTYGTTRATGSTMVLARIPKFLMARNSASVLAQAADLAEERLGEAMRAKRDAEDAAQELKKTREALAKAEEEVKRQESSRRWEAGRANSADEKCRKYEGDIGKLRTAIGELRMKEILASAEEDDR